MNYTNTQSKPLIKQSKCASGVDIIKRNVHAEYIYECNYGDRPVFVHVLSRFAERKSPDFAITPARWPYITRYPNNITVFMTVTPNQFARIDGWQFHKVIERYSLAGGDPGTYIYVGPLEPMSTFNASEAK
jgi:hypothetical protein